MIKNKKLTNLFPHQIKKHGNNFRALYSIVKLNAYLRFTRRTRNKVYH